MDVPERQRVFAWRRMYLSRYARMTIAEIERTPLSLLDAYCEALGELFKAEAPKGSLDQRSEQDFL